jgi:hypothetical protein
MVRRAKVPEISGVRPAKYCIRWSYLIAIQMSKIQCVKRYDRSCGESKSREFGRNCAFG